MPTRKLTRRSFFRAAAKTSAALPVISLLEAKTQAATEGKYPATQASPADFDFSRRSAALEADQIVDSACQFCNSLCRLKVHIKDGRIIDVRGEENDPVQAGGLCVKGETMMTQLVYNRFRLTRPMKRVAGEKGS
jgi:anaerobic selenocysteine-containing dehydrogenase